MNEKFLTKIKEARKRKGLTQEDVAKHLGITRRAYLSFENGDSNFHGGKDGSRFKLLCDLLEIEEEPNLEEERIETIRVMKEDIQILKRMLLDLEKQLTLLEEV